MSKKEITTIQASYIDFAKGQGLVPAIVQDVDTRQVLMLGYMNEEAYQRTIETKRVTFWSRTRHTLWTKGETSGHWLHVVSVQLDCDADTLLVQARPDGPTCHKGTDTCWGEDNTPRAMDFLTELQDYICQRKITMPEGSYTTSLFRKGDAKMAQKVGEEAIETVIEVTSGNNEKLVYESADLLYHLMVLLTAKGLRLDDVAAELAKRHNPQWDSARRKAKSQE